MSPEERAAFNEEWPRKLYGGGWICATWPKEYGGKGLTTMEGVVRRRGVRPGQGADASRLLRRHARRPDAAAVGDRGAEAGVPAQDPARRDALVPGLQRAQLGLRPGQPEDVGDPRRRRVGHQRAEGLDDRRPPRRLLLPAHPHRPRRPEAQGHLVPAGADAASPASRSAASPSPTARPSSARSSSTTPAARRTTSSAASTTAGRSPTRRSASSAASRRRPATAASRRSSSRWWRRRRRTGRSTTRSSASASRSTTRSGRSCASTDCARCRRR